ncbi:MAG: hypothetical protein PHN76_05110 [Advenella sp.]|nr:MULTISPECIES: hypothetical protein [unclassified Advenella]MDD3757524.1 hypothetical protein [Advenella sp.]
MFNLLFNAVKTIFGSEVADSLLCDRIGHKSQEHLKSLLVSRNSISNGPG